MSATLQESGDTRHDAEMYATRRGDTRQDADGFDFAACMRKGWKATRHDAVGLLIGLF